MILGLDVSSSKIGYSIIDQNENLIECKFKKFKTKEDYDKFQKLIEQKLTLKTKSIFYPKDDRLPNRLLRWVVDD